MTAGSRFPGAREGRILPLMVPTMTHPEDGAELAEKVSFLAEPAAYGHATRQVEARADAFALRSTQAPDAAISLQRRMVIRNVGDPAPPGLLVRVLSTHPPPMSRIGMALAYRERRED